MPAKMQSYPSMTRYVITYFDQILAVAGSEFQKMRHDPVDLLTRAIQPALWLTLFGEVMAQVRGLSASNVGYLDFLAAGVLAQSVLFVAIFFGLSAIWERDLGILQRYLVSPAPRSALVIGKALSASLRGLSQGTIIYLLALMLGLDVNLSPIGILGAALLITLGASLFSTLSLVIACLVKSRERFMGIGQVLTMPIFFASSAIYPLALMPSWMQILAKGNPLSYEVDALRTIMIKGVDSVLGLPADFAVLTVLTALLITIAARLYPRLGV